MIDYLDLARRLKGKSLGASLPFEQANALMPRAYRFGIEGGRPYHDDHAIRGVPLRLQPWTRARRMDHTFILPMPFKLLKWWGPKPKPRWMPWQEGYAGGIAPEAVIRSAHEGSEAAERGLPREVLAYDPVLPIGFSALFGIWLDGAWRPCYYTTTRLVLGRRLHHNRGLKPDMTVTLINGKIEGDYHQTWPEASLTLKELPK